MSFFAWFINSVVAPLALISFSKAGNQVVLKSSIFLTPNTVSFAIALAVER